MHGRAAFFNATDIVAIEMQLDAVGKKAALLLGQISSQVIWNDDGSGIVVAIYDSEASAKAAADSFTEIWGGLMPLLEGAPETREFAKVHVMK
ncbi:MAG: hypothetical protein ABJ370_07385 [Paracoccaceae bacterium]